MQKPRGQESSRAVGTYYEGEAAKYLLHLGYKILERNYRCKLGEIDLIAQKDAYIIFIEVKYRKSSLYGLPREAVNYHKQQRIKKVASYYMYCLLKEECLCRFDVIEIINHQIVHLQSAF